MANTSKPAPKKANTDTVLQAALLAKVSRSLRNVLSPRYSTLWQETNWPGNTVSVPTTRNERFIPLQSLSVFYSAHADYEVTKQGLTASASEGRGRRDFVGHAFVS